MIRLTLTKTNIVDYDIHSGTTYIYNMFVTIVSQEIIPPQMLFLWYDITVEPKL